MSSGNTLFGVTRSQQIALVGVVGVVVTVAGLLSSSAVDPEYDPLLFGIGTVMVVYAVAALLYDLARSHLSAG